MADFVVTDEKSWKIDATRWPVLIITRLGETIEDAALKRSLDASDAMIAARNSAYSLVLDNRLARGMTATQRKIIADHMVARAERTRRLCRGTAFVFDSAVMRGILTAIFWLRKPEVETRVFADLDEALRWAAAIHIDVRSGTGG